MKLFVLAMLALMLTSEAHATQLVRGYIRQDGSSVGPYIRTTPNGIPGDNFGGR